MPIINPGLVPIKGHVSIKGNQVLITRITVFGNSPFDICREFTLTPFPQSQPPDSESKRQGIILLPIENPKSGPLIYSHHPLSKDGPSGIKGLSTYPFKGAGLTRPLLNIFFTLFPDITQTHPLFAIWPVQNMLRLEYGFEPTGDSEPKAWFRQKTFGGFEIFFKDEPSGQLFTRLTPGTHGAEFDLLDAKTKPPAGFWPITMGSAYALKDRAAFQRALALFPVIIEK